MDIARLGLAVDSSSVPRASNELNKFSGSADKAGKSADYFQDKAGRWRDKSGKFVTSTERARLGLDNFSGSSQKASLSLQKIGGAIAAATGAVATLGAALRGAEQYTRMTNGLRALGQSASEAAASLEAVAAIANRTRSPLEATANLYRRISTASAELGASQQEVLRFTENVGLALAASGTSANEASGALLQLSQAMAGGTVRAEEFNSILEGAFPLAQAAARGIDEAAGSVGRLRTLVVEGKISSDEFFNAILSQTDALQAAFADTVPTIGQAVTVLGNNFTMLTGKMDAAIGVSGAIAQAILVLADNLDRVAAYAAVAAVGFGGAYVASLVAAAGVTATLTGGLALLRTAIVRTGIGALIVGAGELVYQFSRLVGAAGSFGEAMSLLGDVAKGVWNGIVTSAGAIPKGLEAIWATIAAGFYEMVGDLQRGWLKFLTGLTNSLRDIGADAASSKMAKFAESVGVGLDKSNAKVAEFNAQAEAATDAARSLATDGFAEARAAADRLSAVVVEADENSVSFGGSLGDVDDAAGGAAKEAKALADEIQRLEDAADPTRKFRREMQELDKLLENGLSDGAYEHAVRDLNEELVNSTPILSDLNSAFGDFVDYALDGFKDGMAGIWDIFKRTLTSMIATAAKSRITFGLGMAATGGAGAAAAGQGGGILSSAGGLGNLMGGSGFLGLGGGAGSLFGGSGLLGMGGGSSLFGLGAGSGLANALGGGAFGAAASVALPVIGIGLAIAGLFKKTEVIVSEGVRARIEGASLELDSYTKSKTNNAFGFSSSFKRDFDRMGDAIQETVGARLTATTDALAAFGINTDLTGFSYSRRAAVGDGDTMEGETERVISEVLDEAIRYLSDGALEMFQQTGEGLSGTLDRLTTSFNGVSESLYLLDQNMLPMTLQGADAASKLLDLSGGLESFNEKVGFVFSNMLTEQEQQARLSQIAMEQLNATFGDLGQAIPDTRAEFMALLDAQDLTTSAGRRTYAALLDVAQAFVTVRGAAQQAASSFDYNGEMRIVGSVFSARSRAADSALADAERALRAAFQAEETRIRDAYANQINAARAQADAARASAQASSAAAQERVQLRQSIADALERAYRDRRVLDAMGEMNRLNAGTAFLRAAVAMGGTDDLIGLQSALDAVADPSTALFGSFKDYQHDFNVNTNLIAELKDLNEGQLSVEMRTLRGIENTVDAVGRAGDRQVSALEASRDAQLSAMSSQMNALLGIDTSVLSVEDAIRNLKFAQDAAKKAADATKPRDSGTEFAAGSIAAQINQIFIEELGRAAAQAGIEYYLGDYRSGQSLDDIRRSINNSAEGILFDETGVPQYAEGGTHSGGWRMVGERGPELEYTGPSRIYSNSDTRAMLDRGEERELLREISQRLRYIQDKERERTRITNDWNTNGLPAERTA